MSGNIVNKRKILPPFFIVVVDNLLEKKMLGNFSNTSLCKTLSLWRFIEISIKN